MATLTAGAPRGLTANKSDFPTDKPQEPCFLRLTVVLGMPMLAKISASGVKMETQCHGWRKGCSCSIPEYHHGDL